MRISRYVNLNPTLVPLLAGLLIATPALAAGAGDSGSDKHVAVHCPHVRDLDSGDTGLIALSPRPFLGVEASGLTSELRQHFGVPGDAGVMLSKIVGDSAAEAAGLAVGDIVTRIDGDQITSTGRLGRAVRRSDGGAAVEIEYWRGGEMYHTTATLEERQRCAFDIGDTLRGIKLEDLQEIGEIGIEIGGVALESTLETLRETLAGQDWEKHFEGLKEIDLERLEERMERTQERLELLEERLERDFGRELERAERDRGRAERELERAERTRQRELERAEREADRARELAERERERAEREADRAQDDDEGDT